jgi:glyoxylate reductase
MTHILALAWRLVEADRFTRSGKFRQEQSMSFLCESIPGKVLGLVGLGEIGVQVARRARAFEMTVLYFKRNRLPEAEERELGVTWVDGLNELLERADFLALMADYNPTTHLLIGPEEFQLMKPSAYFINTARGRIVDEAALVAALRSGAIAGAGLDVYWGEPPVSEPSPHPDLLKMDNVILTPHIGSATKESRRTMTRLVVENVAAMIRGEIPRNALNPEVSSEWRQKVSSGNGA